MVDFVDMQNLVLHMVNSVLYLYKVNMDLCMDMDIVLLMTALYVVLLVAVLIGSLTLFVGVDSIVLYL